MEVFLSTLNRMGFLMLLIVIGYIITKLGVVNESSAGILSKLENNIFIPALVLGTFMKNFTPDKINTAWQYLVLGCIVIAISIPIAIFVAKLHSKDDYIRKIYTYGLAFSNFGFMGNAVVEALFPDVFMNYLIFVLPFWAMIYLWGVPTLLIPSKEGKRSFKDKIKPFINPMFIAMFAGIIIGLMGLPIEQNEKFFLVEGVTVLGNCMSPIAMILTGITIAKLDLKATFKNLSIYSMSIIRLIVLPIISIIILKYLPLSEGLKLCTVASLAMPLGLNTIVVPAAYGKDTSVAAGMALISHLLSCATIPIIFMLYDVIL